MKLPNKKYSIIYADPPWFYPRRNPSRAFGKGVDSHYSLMRVEEIAKLPIAHIAKENCVLFLWCTMPYLLPSKSLKGSAIDVIRAWGFRYVTVGFVWIKKNSINKRIFSGPGHYTKSNAELCLLATKGALKIRDRSIKQVFISEKGKHSQKPSELRDKIVQMYGDDRAKIELFAREKTNGWDVWGDEI